MQPLPEARVQTVNKLLLANSANNGNGGIHFVLLGRPYLQVPYVPISSTLRRKQEEVAAKVIQRAYRKRLLRHGEAEKAEQEPVNGI